MPLRHAALFAALLLSLAACGGTHQSGASGSATMRPGEDCLGCHHEFTAAGTVYASASATQGAAGVAVTIYGMTQDVHLTTNGVGNFYTTVSFGYGSGASVQVAGATMSQPLTSSSIGGCNSCHDAGNRVHTP
jgi:hypothetical protein